MNIMNEYEREKNGRKWLIGVVVFILIGTSFLVTQAVIIISSEGEMQKQSYDSGYHDAKIIYDCNHDRTECEILKEEI